jgi:multidrug efflux pump subunit AcrA (membrane-fusion protein)
MKMWWLAGGAAGIVAGVVVVAVVSMGDDKSAPVRVSTVQVARGEVASTISASGAAQAQQSRSLGFANRWHAYGAQRQGR